MADAAAEALVANGFAARSVVVARDVRRVHADAQPGGRPADLDARADLVIFEARLRRTQPVAAHSDWWSCSTMYTWNQAHMCCLTQAISNIAAQDSAILFLCCISNTRTFCHHD